MGRYNQNLEDLIDMDDPAIQVLLSEPPLSHEEKKAQIIRNRQVSKMRKQATLGKQESQDKKNS